MGKFLERILGKYDLKVRRIQCGPCRRARHMRCRHGQPSFGNAKVFIHCTCKCRYSMAKRTTADAPTGSFNR